MSDTFDRERTAALVDEAVKLTAALRIEAKGIKTILDKAFDRDDGDEELLGGDVRAPRPRKLKWWFWR